jgi:carboxyl-terminal processing protease
MFSLDSIHVHNNGKKYITSCHDTLYGGDGITPDVFVSADTNSYKSSINALLGSNKLSSYIYSYYKSHKQEIDQYKTAADYAGRFNAEELWQGYSSLAADSVIAGHWSDTDKNFVKLRLKALLARYRWRNTGFYQVINQEDPALKKVLK